MSVEQIIGLVGPSGVGKGYAKEVIRNAYPGRYAEPVVVTTRPARITDGPDRISGITQAEFEVMVRTGSVLFPHQPFGDGTPYYGFCAESLTGPNLLTEVHIDNIGPFRDRYGDVLRLIDLTASSEYLRHNLLQRGSETESSMAKRLQSAADEIMRIKLLKDRGLINDLIDVDMESRTILGQLIIALLT